MPLSGSTPGRIVARARLAVMAAVCVASGSQALAQARVCDASSVQRIAIDVMKLCVECDFSDNTLDLVSTRADGSQGTVSFTRAGGPSWWLNIESTTLQLPYTPRTLTLQKAGWKLDPDPSRPVRFATLDGRCTVTDPIMASPIWDVEISTDVESIYVRRELSSCHGAECDGKPTVRQFLTVPRGKPFVLVAILSSQVSPDTPIRFCNVSLAVNWFVDGQKRLDVSTVLGKVSPQCRDYIIDKLRSAPYVPRGGIVVKNITRKSGSP